MVYVSIHQWQRWPSSSIAGHPFPSVLSPGTSPRTGQPVPLPAMSAASGWSSHAQETSIPRPSTNAGRTLPRPMPALPERIRPTTAPTHHLNRPNIERKPLESPRASFALPPISSITLRDRDEGEYPRITLPSMQERPYSRDTHSSSSSIVIPHDYHYSFGRPGSNSSTLPWFHGTTPSELRHKDSISTVASDLLTPLRESGPPFDRPLIGTDRPMTGYGSDRPMTGHGSDRPPSSSYDRPFGGYEKPTAYSWDRPTTAGSHVAFDMADKDPNPVYYSPQAPIHARLSNASSFPVQQAHYSRVLVGSLCTACQRLQDDKGEMGLFFFAHDLGVRTEGIFSLKFTLTDLTSYVLPSTMS